MRLKFTLSMLLFACLFANMASAQGQGQLLSRTKYDINGVQNDSMLYFYSGQAKPIPKYANIPEFVRMDDSSRQYKNGKLAFRTICVYNGSGDFVSSITDTINGTTYVKRAQVRMVYKNNKPDTAIYETWNTQGAGSWRLSAAIVYTWSGNNIATATRFTRSFGRNPKWNNDWRVTYAYSGGNLVDSAHEDYTSSTWTKTRRKKYTWTSGKLTQIDEEGNDGSNAWKSFYRATIKYDAQNRIIDVKNDANDNAGGWKPFLRDTMMFIATNTTVGPDTIIRLDASSGSYVNVTKIAYKQKSNGLITWSKQFSWNGTAWLHQNSDSSNTWNWGAGASVNDVAKTKNILNVYPSPASSQLHITLQGIAGKKVEFVITDMQGKAVKMWSETPNGLVSTDVSTLPAGNYILRMNDGAQVDAVKFAISR